MDMRRRALGSTISSVREAAAQAARTPLFLYLRARSFHRTDQPLERLEPRPVVSRCRTTQGAGELASLQLSRARRSATPIRTASPSWVFANTLRRFVSRSPGLAARWTVFRS